MFHETLSQQSILFATNEAENHRNMKFTDQKVLEIPRKDLIFYAFTDGDCFHGAITTELYWHKRGEKDGGGEYLDIGISRFWLRWATECAKLSNDSHIRDMSLPVEDVKRMKAYNPS